MYAVFLLSIGSKLHHYGEGAVFNTAALTGEQWGACLAIALVGLPIRAAVTAAMNAKETATTDDTEVATENRSRPGHMPRMTLRQWFEMKLFRGIF